MRVFFLAVLVAALFVPAATAETVVFELSQMNGVWRDLATTPQPFETGGLTVALRSPSHWLEVHDNRALFVPNGDGTHRTTLSATFEGGGDLIADVYSQGQLASSFDDRVVVPRQTVAVTGQVRWARAEDGFVLILLELPATTAIRIDSQLVASIVDSCAAFSLFLALDCDRLGQSLGRVDVDLPPAGSEFLIEDAWLTDHERSVLMGLVSGSV
ncbi:MAG: hypothetical protein AAGD38_24150 [Acidobacteriota bacterium]